MPYTVKEIEEAITQLNEHRGKDRSIHMTAQEYFDKCSDPNMAVDYDVTMPMPQQITEDAEFEIIEPKRIGNGNIDV